MTGRNLRFIVLTFAMMCALAVSITARQQAHPLEGEFTVTATGGEIGTVTFTMIFKQSGGKWMCEVKDSPMPITVNSVTLDADKITIAATVDGQDLTITGKLDGQKLAGNWSVSDANGTWSAMKKTAAQTTPASTPGSVEGTYDAQIVADGQGTLPFTLIIKREGDKLVTEVKDAGPINITAIKVEGDNVTLSASYEGNPFDLPGKRTGSEMGGKWEAGGFSGSWSAKKKASSQTTRIPGQFAEDFVAGRVPAEEEIAALEKEVAANPNDFRLTRKLGKGYFFQVFGEGRWSSAAKSQKLLEHALELKKDDAESIAYLGALAGLKAQKSKDAAERDALFRQSFEMLKRAQQLSPNHGAVLSVTGASYLFLPDSFNAAPLAAEAMERIRQLMGPMFDKFSHHGRQRILLTQGQAYARLGQMEKARACFDQALKIDQESVEASLIKTEIAKLKP
jgi:Flp pilus assembly protein TadD